MQQRLIDTFGHRTFSANLLKLRQGRSPQGAN